MKLSVETITEEFEALIREKIKHKVPEYTIREADMDDFESIAHIFDKAWHATHMPYHPLSRKKIITKVFENPNSMILIANIEGEDCGFTFIHQIREDVGEISALGILPEFHHKGLGTLLGIASWDFFKVRGVKQLRCKVYKDNEVSKAFMKGLGFEEDYDENSTLLSMKIPI